MALRLCFLISLALLLASCTSDRGRGGAFAGVCLGEPYPNGSGASCGELFNDSRGFCELHAGCSWQDCDGSCGFCQGHYNGCRSREDEGGCLEEPGCAWWAPPTCDTWTDCVVTWLHDGGCEEIAEQPLIGYGDGEEEVWFADHCP